MKTRRTDHPRRRVDRRGKVAISRVPLHEQVADEIRHMIVSGELPPGEKIRVSELAEDLDVSLTPLREALKILDKDGLVELMTNRGARVSEISVEGTRSLFEVNSRIEALAAELAASRITEREMQTLEELHARMRDRHEAGDLPDYFDLNRQIHDLVVEAAKNPELARIRTGLAFHVERARFLSVASEGHRGKSMQDHERLMAALRLRDAAAAHDVWREHLERAGNETCRLVGLWKKEAETTAAE
ncbi:GntR family transcriptional regulator [Sedimentitalea sp. JM2-8]|uniref:GntR family transcriptional regulator n=1 Tax=Sedimentitalea xiamensis TaxID=3050037 RepID=A0ABT7FIN4_9RHOB|nr:GntR family transcriptional regulator [Sedimentitalea xiamensis]MDK3074996.1 GntR family transcriptional regulator [Sedimentitalea xiamensis]